MKPYILTLSLAALTLTPQADAAWQRLGGLDSRPVDLASSGNGISSIASSKGVAQPENLINDDVTLGAKVGPGVAEVVVALARQTVVNVVSVVNDGAEGRLSIEASVDNQKWIPIKQTVFTAADQTIFSKFAGAQVKYLKVQLDLSKGGSLRALDIYGADTDLDYETHEAKPGEPSVALNGAGAMGGGRIIYINPSPIQGDEVAAKYGRFEFPESPDRFRTVIYDFGSQRTLTEFGSVHSPRPVRFTAYTFEKELPEKEDWRGRKSFDPSVFDSMKPVATVEDSKGVGYVKTKLQKSVRARYVALRWEPDFNPPGFGVSGASVTISGMSPPNRQNGQGNGSGSGSNGSGGGNNGNNQPEDPNNPGGFGGSMFNNPFSISSGGYGGAGLPSAGQTNEQNASP